MVEAIERGDPSTLATLLRQHILQDDDAPAPAAGSM